MLYVSFSFFSPTPFAAILEQTASFFAKWDSCPPGPSPSSLTPVSTNSTHLSQHDTNLADTSSNSAALGGQKRMDQFFTTTSTAAAATPSRPLPTVPAFAISQTSATSIFHSRANANASTALPIICDDEDDENADAQYDLDEPLPPLLLHSSSAPTLSLHHHLMQSGVKSEVVAESKENLHSIDSRPTISATSTSSSSSKPRVSLKDVIDELQNSPLTSIDTTNSSKKISPINHRPEASGQSTISSSTSTESSSAFSSLPTHLSLSCRNCSHDLATSPLVRRVSTAPPYQQTVCKGYFARLVAGALDALEQKNTNNENRAEGERHLSSSASLSASSSFSPHVPSIVASTYALEPCRSGTFGWIGYPLVTPEGLPAGGFPDEIRSGQFFNVFIEQEQICYQPLRCTQCRSFVGVQILIDRSSSEGNEGSHDEFEEKCWIASSLIKVEPVTIGDANVIFNQTQNMIAKRETNSNSISQHVKQNQTSIFDLLPHNSFSCNIQEGTSSPNNTSFEYFPLSPPPLESHKDIVERVIGKTGRKHNNSEIIMDVSSSSSPTVSAKSLPLKDHTNHQRAVPLPPAKKQKKSKSSSASSSSSALPTSSSRPSTKSTLSAASDEYNQWNDMDDFLADPTPVPSAASASVSASVATTTPPPTTDVTTTSNSDSNNITNSPFTKLRPPTTNPYAYSSSDSYSSGLTSAATAAGISGSKWTSSKKGIKRGFI